MTDTPNTLIEQIFANFTVDKVVIPVSFLQYNGTKNTYVTYQQVYSSQSLSGDDELLNYLDFYDFDVFTKGNYIPIVEAIKTLLEANGFRWRPDQSSGDMFDAETGLYHKTLSFSIERSTQNG